METTATRRWFLAATCGLTTTASLAGCSGDGSTETPTPEPTLSVAEFVFAADQPAGYDDYTERANATYSLDETIWLYIDVLNIGSESAGDNTVVIDLTETIEVVGPNGEAFIDDEIQFDNEFSQDVDLQTFFIANDVHLPSDAPTGDYDVRISLSDGTTGESTDSSGTFTIEG